MLCPPQFANGPLSKAFSGSSIDVSQRRSSTSTGDDASGSGFAAFLAQAHAGGPGFTRAQKQKATTAGPSERAGLPSLLIENVRLPPTPRGKTSEDRTAQQINHIGRAVRTVYSCPTKGRLSAGQSFETLYQMTDDVVVVAKQGGALFERVKMEMERAVGQMASRLRSSSSDKGDGDEAQQQHAWLVELTAAWTEWCERTTLICSILTLLDQVYLAERPDMPSLWTMSMELVKHSVAEEDFLQQHALSCITVVCNSIRKGRNIDYRSLHLDLLSMYSSLSLYEAIKNNLLTSTQSFYTEEASQAIEVMDLASFLTHAKQRVEQENVQAQWLYTDAAGRTAAMAIVHDTIIKQHTEALVSGVPELLSGASVVTLAYLYGFLSTVKQLPALRTRFGQYVREHGEEIVQDKERDEDMIERLLTYKATIDRIVREAFLDDIEFRQTQKESFEKFVNKRENKAAEYIAKYLDARLRSGNKTMSDQELEHTLNEALILFRYTHAKDMFEEFYKRLFAKRLLLNRSASSDAEQSMLLKLKDECGAAFTQKLETMLTDIALSDDMMKAYSGTREKAATEHTDAFELSVNVLTQAHWPTYPRVDVILPPEMATATEDFGKFYETRSQGRKLQWTHSLGTTSLTAYFAKAGEKELLVSTFQTVILLLFNSVTSNGKLSYAQIKEQTGIEDRELKRTLQSLACGQIPTRVLRKDPQGKEVNEDDHFAVNEQLKNERKRIRINMIQLNETKEEQKSTVDRVMFDREMIVQATAVRILKAKKTIKHAELLQEIVESIAARFTVDVAEIKKAFEVLIDKEYMERVEGQRGVYRYLA